MKDKEARKIANENSDRIAAIEELLGVHGYGKNITTEPISSFLGICNAPNGLLQKLGFKYKRREAEMVLEKKK